MSVQLQWGLEQTSFKSLEAVRDLVRAASTDNVQSLAIIACEQLGVTLPMCPTTCSRITNLVAPTRPPGVVSFLQATVGYSAGDCVSLLSRNDAGIQFLGLASALVTTMEPFRAGLALHMILVNSARDKRDVPTSRHVQELLKSIEGRCHRSGFAEDVVGWQVLLANMISSESRGHHYPRRFGDFPTPEVIEKLVDSFRQIRRIGDDDLTKISIRTNRCAAWAVAFTKWCLGVPPSVMLEDGTTILRQKDAEAEIIITQPGKDAQEFVVTVLSSISGPSRLVEGKTSEEISGMIGIEAYGKLLLRDYRMDTEHASRVLDLAVPYALGQVLDLLRVSADRNKDLFGGEGSLLPGYQEDPTALDEELKRMRPSPFPDKDVVSRVWSQLKGLSDTPIIRDLPEGLLVYNLPAVETYFRCLEKECKCSECTGNSPYFPCSKSMFSDRFSFLISDILALSLFERPDGLLVTTRSRIDERTVSYFSSSVKRILKEGKPATCGVFDVLRWALYLVGHVFDKRVGEWVMSCLRGQAIWPSIYDSLTIPRAGYLSLSWLPGKLQHDQSTYTIAVGPTWCNYPKNVDESYPPEPVSEPRNRHPDVHLDWSVTSLDGALEVALRVKEGPEAYQPMSASPARFLDGVCNSLLVEHCPHSRDRKLDAPDPFTRYMGPFAPVKVDNQASTRSRDDFEGHPLRGLLQQFSNINSALALTEFGGLQENDSNPQSETASAREPEVISVVAVAGSDELRFLSLTREITQPMVIRGDACLVCCLDICRRAGFSMLIL